MTKVRIDRLSATATGWPDPDEVPRMLGHIAADRLESALRESPLPAGEWCVQRLDVSIELDPGRPLSALETDWADRIVTVLRLSLHDGSANVVRYVRPEAAVDDLLAGLALGRFEHAWAWHQVGLLEVGGPEPRSDPTAVCLRALANLPHGRAAAVARLVSRAGVPAVHRLLGSGGWARVAALVASESGATWTAGDMPASPRSGPEGPDDRGRGGSAGGEEVVGAGGAPAMARRTSLDELAAGVVRAGGLASTLRGSALRVDRQTLQAWAVLAIGAADPTLLRCTTRRLLGLVEAVSDRLRPTAGPGLAAVSVRRGPSNIPTTTPTRDATHDPGTHRSLPSTDRGAQFGADPPRLPDGTPQSTHDSQREHADERALTAMEGKSTRWGGLLFLLNSSSVAGLPELFDEPPFHARPAPWVMHRLGLAMVPLAPDDPALRAFAGTGAHQPQSPPDEAEERAIAACASRWVAGTAQLARVGSGTDERSDAEVVHGMAGRTATIAQEPGWVEVQLRLDQIDLDVRRVGLDIDPGWLWWLGHVVRFRYE